MSTNHTSNYQLSQWEPGDAVLRADFNADNAKIDGALNSLSQTVSGHTSTLNSKGNCRIYTTSYTGNGLCGPSYPNSLYFPKKPSIVFILSPEGYRAVFGQYMTKTRVIAPNGFSWDLDISWSGTTMNWSFNNVSPADNQLNASGKSYTVIAFMPT